MNKNSKIFISGHKGLVGSAIINYLKKKSFTKIYSIKKKKIRFEKSK